jgi:hypothetical protein
LCRVQQEVGGEMCAYHQRFVHGLCMLLAAAGVVTVATGLCSPVASWGGTCSDIEANPVPVPFRRPKPCRPQEVLLPLFQTSHSGGSKVCACRQPKIMISCRACRFCNASWSWLAGKCNGFRQCHMWRNKRCIQVDLHSADTKGYSTKSLVGPRCQKLAF